MRQKTKQDKGKAVARAHEGELPAELDFFKYAQGGSSKRPADQDKDKEGYSGGETSGARKKRKLDEGDGEEAERSDEDDPPMPRHRVTTKGSNVPQHIESFQQLEERYHTPSYLLSNLKQSGYKRPTGIQSHGIPILMEVRKLLNCDFKHF